MKIEITEIPNLANGYLKITDGVASTDSDIGPLTPITSLPVGGLVFDENKLYVLSDGDDTITIADSGHSTGSKYIEIYKTMSSTDVFVIDLSKYSIDIKSTDWIGVNGVFTSRKPYSPVEGGVVYLKIMAYNGIITDIETYFSEIFTPESRSFLIDSWETDFGVDVGVSTDDAVWTSKKLGLELIATGLANPSFASSAWSFNGTTQGFRLTSSLLNTLVRDGLNDKSFGFYVVGLKPAAKAGVSIPFCSFYSSTDADIVTAIYNASTEKGRFFSKTSNATPVLATTTTDFPVDEYKIVNGFLDETNGSVSIGNETLVDVADTTTGNYDSLDRFGVGVYKLGAGADVFFQFSIKAIYITTGKEDRDRFNAYLAAKYSL